MITSRNTADLYKPVRTRVEAFVRECAREGIDLLITCTYRDNEAQDALYAQGRTTPGNIVTSARGGQSMHNYHCAVDVVPMRNGKCVWSTKGNDGALWRKVGMIGESCGLEWAGRWTGKLKEMAHFQFTAGLTLAQLQAGDRTGLV